ncbi:Alpha/Beta hydrolase protein [Mycena rosella]|uniref:Alpha/Beta hydrolase protein n=1 Tax=Mycena rosella TaxID=1033263 RepID=A0AAD7D066_MYCRO|nr:Alpha/Beta hydrolase protein [Mycena rosella]
MAQAYTEHTLKLPDGIEILYTDSGAPKTTDYTTLVVVHGTGFNGYGFIPLHEYAHKYNLRIILWNRREYRGSTKYSDEELADLKAGRKVFQDRLAIQTAWFLEHFIKNESSPKVTADRSAGGFILMGWSFGNATTLALFADPAVIPKPLYETVEPHLRSLVLYDPPFLVMDCASLMLADGVQDPFNNHAVTTDEAHDIFRKFISSYFKSNILAGRLSYETLADKQPTIHRWTKEEIDKYCDSASAINLDFLASMPPMAEILRSQAHHALFDETVVASHFPDVNVFYITGEETACYCIWAYTESSRMYREALERGARPRPTKFKLVPEGNHFLHYDVPEQFLRDITEGCAK